MTDSDQWFEENAGFYQLKPYEPPVVAQVVEGEVVDEDGNTLQDLANSANYSHREVQKAAYSALFCAQEAGLALQEAKQHVKHGEWGRWVADNCEFGERTARGYMMIAERWAELEAENGNGVADMSVRGALKALGKPKKSKPRAKPKPKLALVAEPEVGKFSDAEEFCRHLRAAMDYATLVTVAQIEELLGEDDRAGLEMLLGKLSALSW